ncbi:alpha/beta hydrolase [Autumnicola edwardsiae]|uniref:Alpha/beta hydrolase n=1 Tax=Autumnicola edwardsiae TaxID=3075594 RepID=A0ABU3CTF6_9FLAO|nr:alpha/beta hydrolase [Zunongwangia sp. F297]MDT0649512.1 alpha/beta hydrolase [Zunongwangia sp. F297]
MKNAIFGFILFLAGSAGIAQEFTAIWPEGNMPNSKGLKLEHIEKNQRITQVAEPGFYSFFPANEENKGAVVLILPSGGYHHLTYNLGGFQVAKWFNTMGIPAFVLNYRLPTSPDLKVSYKGPIQDAQRAMKIIRANAEKYKIDPEKIGIFATSAGGHLATTLGTHSEDFSAIKNDTLNDYSFKPNFMVLISPVISFGKYAHEGSIQNFFGESPSEKLIKEYSNELHVNENTPPSFLVHAQNDKSVSAMNSILFYEAMMKSGVKGSLHFFPKGQHAIGITNESVLTDEWKDLCEKWLKEEQVIN